MGRVVLEEFGRELLTTWVLVRVQDPVEVPIPALRKTVHLGCGASLEILLGNLDNIIVIEVEACYCIVGFWVARFFFDGDSALVVVKLHYTKALRVTYLISIYCCSNFSL